MSSCKNSVKVLGASGGKQNGCDLISIELDKGIILDAGNIMNAKGIDIFEIEHIFITHSHLDHIVDIGLLIDTTSTKRKKPLKIYGSSRTLESIRTHILTWEIWPDFSNIHLLNSKTNAIEFVELNIGQTVQLNGIKIKSIKNNHTISSNGYVLTKDKSSICFTSDTYICSDIWDEINNNIDIKALVIEVSFTSDMSELAKQSKHLTPELLRQELNNLKRDDVVIYINHIKPSFKKEILKELDSMKDMLNGGYMLNSNDIIEF